MGPTYLVFLIFAPFQSRTIIAAIVLATGLAGARGAPQTGLVAVFLINHFATVLKGRQTSLHIVKLRGRDNVLLTRRQNPGDLFLRLGDAIRCLRVGRKSLGQGSGLLLFLGLNLFEEADEGVGVVSRFVHVLQSQIVSLGFET